MASSGFSESDPFLFEVDRVRDEIRTNFSQSHEILHERESVLLSELDELVNTYTGEEVMEQIQELNRMKETLKSTVGKNKNLQTIGRNMEPLDACIRELEVSLETAKRRMKRVELEWDGELEEKLSQLGNIKLVKEPESKKEVDEDSNLSKRLTGKISKEKMNVIEGLDVDLMQETSENPTDNADKDLVTFLLRGEQNRALVLAMSGSAFAQIRSECLSLFESDRLPHIEASNLEIIYNTQAELMVYASSVKVATSYLGKKYSEVELASILLTQSLGLHLMAEGRDWCVIEVDGFPNFFGARNLFPDD